MLTIHALLARVAQYSLSGHVINSGKKDSGHSETDLIAGWRDGRSLYAHEEMEYVQDKDKSNL
jgi:hypothetical protein